MLIDSVLVRKLTATDLWNMERRLGQGPEGGGGQTYIDMPLGNISFDALAEFLSVPVSEIESHQDVRIYAYPIGEGSASYITFSSRGQANRERYRIANQNRHRENNDRHDGWAPINQFPTIPTNVNSSGDIPEDIYRNVRLIIIKTISGKYYAGYINSDGLPGHWPKSKALDQIFHVRSSEIIYFDTLCKDSIIVNIFSAWKSKPNVLLYGPPGTGKTHIMAKLWDVLNGGESIECLSVDPNNINTPFYYEETAIPIEEPVKSKWITFHQNYSYENFILSLKPIPNGVTFELKPYAGALLDSALCIDPEIQSEFEIDNNPSTSILFIDELNRGNVSRIFGELITFMDFDYRKVDWANPIPVPLNNLKLQNRRRTENIVLNDGTEVNIPVPWFFPKNVFIIASMNSVDKAVSPLDSALSRRIHKINIFPSMQDLAFHLDISDPDKLFDMNYSCNDDIRAEEVAWLLLYRLNYILAATMGKDFELGQTYFYSIKYKNSQDEKYRELARVWDEFIYPQILERYSGRPNEIMNILRIDQHIDSIPGDHYLFKQKQRPLSESEDRVNSPWTLEEVILSKEYTFNADKVKYTLKFLAGLSA